MQKTLLEQAYSTGTIQVGTHAWVGGLIGQATSGLSNDKNCIHHVYSRSQLEFKNHTTAGGLIGEIRHTNLDQAYFSGIYNGPADAVAGVIFGEQGNHANITQTYWYRNNTSELETTPSMQPQTLSDVQLTSTLPFPAWLRSNVWLRASHNLELAWPKRQDALNLLQYANSLKKFKSTGYHLPLELDTQLLSYAQFYHSLTTTQIIRLLDYATTPIHSNIQGTTRKLWHKESFLNYVLNNQGIVIPAGKRKRS